MVSSRSHSRLAKRAKDTSLQLRFELQIVDSKPTVMTKHPSSANSHIAESTFVARPAENTIVEGRKRTMIVWPASKISLSNNCISAEEVVRYSILVTK